SLLGRRVAPEFLTDFSAYIKKPNSAFIDYPDRHAAATAFQKISSLEPVYGKKIRVEYALPSQATLARDRSTKEKASEEGGDGKNEAGEIEILQNITSAIAAVPRLYTQVLHLMNKMNLPPPFGPVYENSVPELLHEQILKKRKKRKRDELLSSDESEMSSEGDEGGSANQAPKPVAPAVKKLRDGRGDGLFGSAAWRDRMKKEKEKERLGKGVGK
ncbi:755_t:CDS:2, partial [Paraglomus occultum]